MMYFEDFAEQSDQKWVSRRRTITETDVVLFTSMTGITDPVFNDEIFAQENMFGGRIVPGPLVMTYAMGLTDDMCSGSVVAALGINNAAFVNPTRPQDTIWVKTWVVEARASSSRPEYGVVTLGHEVVNDAKGKAQSFERTLLIHRRPQSDAAAGGNASLRGERLVITGYYDQLAEGQTGSSRGRTITEADVVGFAGLSGDFHPLHMDSEFAAQARFGKRIGHGMLTLAVTSGLMTLSPEAVEAFYGMDKVRFLRPVMLGDTIHVETTVAEMVPRAEGGGGRVRLDVSCLQPGRPAGAVVPDDLRGLRHAFLTRSRLQGPILRRSPALSPHPKEVSDEAPAFRLRRRVERRPGCRGSRGVRRRSEGDRRRPVAGASAELQAREAGVLGRHQPDMRRCPTSATRATTLRSGP